MFNLNIEAAMFYLNTEAQRHGDNILLRYMKIQR